MSHCPKFISTTRIAIIGLLALFILATTVGNPSTTHAAAPLKIAYCTDTVPFHFTNKAGQPDGILIDFWKLWAHKNDIKINFIPAEWDETLAMVRNGEADAHAGLFKTEARAKYLDYGPALTKTDTHIFYHQSLPQLTVGKELIPYRVGVIEGDVVEGYLKKHIPELFIVPYQGYEAMMKDIQKGHLKTFAADTPTALYYLKEFNLSKEFQHHASKPLYKSDWFIAVPKGKGKELATITDGMEKLTPKERLSIIRKWSSVGLERNAETLVIAMDRNYPPMSLIGGEGAPQGLLVDIWKLWADKIGVDIDFRPSDWAGTLEGLQNGEADIHIGLFKSTERDKWMDFGAPIYTIKTALYFKKDIAPQPLSTLEGKRIGVVKGWYQEGYLLENHPNVEVVSVASVDDLIIHLLKGQVDAAVCEILIFEAALKTLGLRGSADRLPTPILTNDIHIGFAAGRPQLAQKVESGFSKITGKELAEIENRWITDKKDRQYTADMHGIGLTQREIDWIAKNPTITVAATPDWPPFESRDEDGVHVGIAVDFLQLAIERTGLKKTARFLPWDQVISQLKSGEADLSPGIVENEERKAFLNFTAPYLIYDHAIITQESRSDIKTFEDLKGLTVSVEKGFYNESMFRNKYPSVKLLSVENTLEAIKAVSSGQAQAYVGLQAVATFLMDKHLITNLHTTAFVKGRKVELRTGIRKSAPLLHSILTKAYKSITPKERKAIIEKHIRSGTVSKGSRKQLILTEIERQWIAEHKNIRLGVDAAWPPIEYFMGTTYSGLAAEYFKMFALETGLTYQDPPIFNWSHVVKLAKKKKIDVLPAVTRTPDREKYLAFTKPYVRFPVAIYQRTNAVPIKNMEELDDKRVGVIEGYAIHELLEENHSDIIIQAFRNVEKAIEALSRGEIDAYAGNIVATEYAKQTLSIFNVAASIKTPYLQELSFGVRQDWPQLVRILNKWLDTLDDDHKARLEEAAGATIDLPMLAEGTKQSVDTSQLLYLGAGIILIFGLALVLMLFIKRMFRNKAATLYSSHQYKIVGIVVGILFLCLVVVGTWLTLADMERRSRYNIGEALESVLLSTHEALAIWEKQAKNQLIELADSPTLRGMTASLMTLPQDPEILKNSPLVWNIRKQMGKLQETRGFSGFSIVSHNFTNYAASKDEDLTDKNIISIQRPGMLDKVFHGNTVFVPPIRTSTVDNDGYSTDSVVISLAAPIKSYGKIIGALILHFDASDNYQRIIDLGHLGKTGETYAFDKNGRLMSQSRFSEQLTSSGLLEANQQAMLNLRIADPGGDVTQGYVPNLETVLPLTIAAQSAVMSNSGVDTTGYRDYRGVPVFGAWLWDQEFGLGLIAEMDETEALGSFRMVRNAVIAVILVTILLGTLMTGLSNWIGQSAARSLKKAKEELEDRVEERTADLKKISVAVEQSPSTVVITDTEGTIQYVNPMFTEMTGYTEEEALGQNPRVLKSGEHSSDFYEDMWTTISGGKIWNGDLLNRKKNGDLFWERASIAPIFDDDTIITHYVAVKEDITDRKAEEERFQALLDAAPDAMVIINRDGTIALVNTATETLFGYSREELLGEYVEVLVPEEIRAEHPEFREKFFTSGYNRDLVSGKEFVGQTKSGNMVPVDIGLSPIETDDGIQMIASIRDITERRKAEAAIAESEERTRLILSSAGEGIFGVNLHGELVFINEAACEMVGYSSEEMMGKSVHDIIHHSRPDGSFYPVEECPMRDAFMLGVSSRIDDEVLWRKDGTQFQVEYAAVPVLRNGKKIGAVISFQDISQRKAMERDLIAAKEKAEVLSRDFSNFLESTSDLVYLKDRNLRYLACSKPLAYMLGYKDWRDVVGSTDAEIANVNTAIHFTPEPEMLVMENGEVLALEENIIKLGDKMGWASTIKKPLLDNNKETVGILSISRDITEMKEMTQALEIAKAKTDDALSVVTSSIQYASRIQRSVLPPEGQMETFASEHFVVWEPRDVVGGDLYWCESWGDGGVIMLGDCTGHGVPGAFMTLLSTGAFENALMVTPEGDCAALVSHMHQLMQSQLGQDVDINGNTGSDDGLELAICYIPPKAQRLTYCGARMPLFIDRGDEITVTKSDKKGIAYRGIPYDYEYTNHSFTVKEGMTFIMTTDGLIDQVGGEKRRGYGKKRFLKLLESLRDTPLHNRGEKIYAELLSYQGDEKRRDDVSIIGFKL